MRAARVGSAESYIQHVRLVGGTALRDPSVSLTPATPTPTPTRTTHSDSSLNGSRLYLLEERRRAGAGPQSVECVAPVNRADVTSSLGALLLALALLTKVPALFYEQFTFSLDGVRQDLPRPIRDLLVRMIDTDWRLRACRFPMAWQVPLNRVLAVRGITLGVECKRGGGQEDLMLVVQRRDEWRQRAKEAVSQLRDVRVVPPAGAVGAGPGSAPSIARMVAGETTVVWQCWHDLSGKHGGPLEFTFDLNAIGPASRMERVKVRVRPMRTKLMFMAMLIALVDVVLDLFVLNGYDPDVNPTWFWLCFTFIAANAVVGAVVMCRSNRRLAGCLQVLQLGVLVEAWTVVRQLCVSERTTYVDLHDEFPMFGHNAVAALGVLGVFLEGIPQSVLQTYTAFVLDQPPELIGPSVFLSCVAIAFTLADLDWKGRVEVHARGGAGALARSLLSLCCGHVTVAREFIVFFVVRLFDTFAHVLLWVGFMIWARPVTLYLALAWGALFVALRICLWYSHLVPPASRTRRCARWFSLRNALWLLAYGTWHTRFRGVLLTFVSLFTVPWYNCSKPKEWLVAGARITRANYLVTEALLLLPLVASSFEAIENRLLLAGTLLCTVLGVAGNALLMSGSLAGSADGHRVFETPWLLRHLTRVCRCGSAPDFELYMGDVEVSGHGSARRKEAADDVEALERELAPAGFGGGGGADWAEAEAAPIPGLSGAEESEVKLDVEAWSDGDRVGATKGDEPSQDVRLLVVHR